MFKEHADKVCFITPDVTQFIKLYEGEVTDLHDLGALISFYPGATVTDSFLQVQS